MRRIAVFFIIFSSIFITIALAPYFFDWRKNTGEKANYPFLLPGQNEDKFRIKTKEGEVEVNNIYRNPVAKLSLEGVEFDSNDNYALDFYPQDQGFLIVIENSNIQSARDLAEKAFLEKLGITKNDACKLNVSLSVPFEISESASGENYGLSFCPNGKDFPK